MKLVDRGKGQEMEFDGKDELESFIEKFEDHPVFVGYDVLNEDGRKIGEVGRNGVNYK